MPKDPQETSQASLETKQFFQIKKYEQQGNCSEMDWWIGRQVERQVDKNSNNNIASLKQLSNLDSIPPSK